MSPSGLKFRISLSVLQSYEGFGALVVTLVFADGRESIGPVEMSGFHDERTSIPVLQTVAVVDGPLHQPFDITIRAPTAAEAADASASKILVTGVFVSPVVAAAVY